MGNIEQPRIIQLVYKAPVAIIGIIGFVYAMQLMYRFKEDTTFITNTAFAIIATLAALSFSFARVIEPQKCAIRSISSPVQREPLIGSIAESPNLYGAQQWDPGQGIAEVLLEVVLLGQFQPVAVVGLDQAAGNHQEFSPDRLQSLRPVPRR